MAKDDSSFGLFSKVARFVINPTKNWSEIRPTESRLPSGYSKDALKAMIVRKKQNDFVRKREFDVLRKLRRIEPAHTAAKADRPSYFQSSLPSNADDRAMTVRKIDEIEAQMSHQWWRGKGNEAALGGGVSPAAPLPTAPPSSPPRLHDVHTLPTPTRPAPAQTAALHTALNSAPAAATPSDPRRQAPDAAGPSLPASPPAPDNQAEPTTPVPLSKVVGPPPLPISKTAALEPPPSWGKSNNVRTDFATIGSGFAISNIFDAEVAGMSADVELEEAAIRFANGDDAGAEEALLTALRAHDLQPERVEAWVSALFDLYRATGQQARFDEVALDFASRFGRSAPAWFSTPDLLKGGAQASNSKGGLAGPAVSTGDPLWAAPAVVTLESLGKLRHDTKGKPAPWILEWSALVSIEPEAWSDLGELFASWCITPATLVFRGADVLDRALKALTSVGEKTIPPAVWQMRMDVLRVMGLHDEFEMTALDFCVTFEVSPPSWQKALCQCKLENLGEMHSLVGWYQGREGKEPWKDSILLSAFIEEDSVIGNAMIELRGEILSDASEALAELEAVMGEGATQIVVSCEYLMRVDFSAAGSILNWAAGQKASGCAVQFSNVNRIVAAFFHVIGINEFARVVPRNT